MAVAYKNIRETVNIFQQNELDRTNALIGRLVRLQGHEFPLPSDLEGREFESRSGYIFLSPKNKKTILN